MRVAIAGGGWVAEARHLPCFLAQPGVAVLGVIDPRPNRAEELARRFNLPHAACASRFQDAPWLKEADALVVTTPPATHFDWIEAALAQGLDVLTEKPFGLERGQGDDLVARAKAAGRVLALAHNNLFTRAARTARRWLEQGRLGDLAAIHIHLLNSPERHLPPWYDQLPFGLLFDELSHFLYLSDSFLEGIRVCSGTAFPSRRGMATPSLATLDLRSRTAPLHFTLNFESPVCEWQALLVGTRGLALLDIFRDIPVFIPTDRRHSAADHLRTMLCATAGYWSGFAASGARHVRGRLLYGADEVARRFVASCASRAEDPLIGAERGLKVFHLLGDCISALDKGRQTDAFDLTLPPAPGA